MELGVQRGVGRGLHPGCRAGCALLLLFAAPIFRPSASTDLDKVDDGSSKVVVDMTYDVWGLYEVK